MPRQMIPVVVPFLMFPSGCGGGAGSGTPLPPLDPKKATIALRSPAFADGQAIPKVYTCDGKDVSPPLSWSGVPASAHALVLTCHDPDAPGGAFWHWTIHGIPPATTELKENLPRDEQVAVGPGGAVARQARNDFGKVGYGGPCPPRGTHRYVFQLFAVDLSPDKITGSDQDQVLRAINGHVVAEGRLVGTYSR